MESEWGSIMLTSVPQFPGSEQAQSSTKPLLSIPPAYKKLGDVGKRELVLFTT